MSKDAGFTSKHLEDRVNKLLKRFEEQKGIINAYIKREREWKKDKVLHKKIVSQLEKEIKKINNEPVSYTHLRAHET